MNKEYLLALLKSRAEYLTGQRNALTQELTLIADEISGMEKRIEADRLATKQQGGEG